MNATAIASAARKKAKYRADRYQRDQLNFRLVRYFVAGHCFHEDGVRVAKSDLYEAFLRAHPGGMSQCLFGRQMRHLGYKSGSMTMGNDKAWLGIAELIYLEYGMTPPH